MDIFFSISRPGWYPLSKKLTSIELETTRRIPDTNKPGRLHFILEAIKAVPQKPRCLRGYRLYAFS
jgi:hypothetical protein